MVIKKMGKLLKIIILLFICSINLSSLNASSDDFNSWIKSFKLQAIDYGISQSTVDKTLSNVKYLSKVIEYDRYQPEFYEDTFTYINKRTGRSKLRKGLSLYKKNKEFINTVEKEFSVEKELLLSLMGIETNFGNYLGKMDILSSLATLSFDKRRSVFFTNELLTLLKLVDDKKIDIKILYGSWAGAIGNFQFMPSTINNYAIDYDKNSIIELKKFDDSYASAANYLNKMGWEKNNPCFIKVKLKKNIPKNFLNKSAKKIINKKKFKFFKQYIESPEKYNISDNLLSGIITPDKDIVAKAKDLEPAYVVFNNYELILKWNRSLRFALAVCTLKDQFKNEI